MKKLILIFGLISPLLTSAQPNVVFFFIDDMGWRDVGFMGNTFVETPHLDALAKEGVVFNTAYSSAPNCAPARACLMSGQYPPRHGVYTVVDDRHAPGSPHHRMMAAESKAELSTESVTLAEQLKTGGYKTAMFGMWNLGRGRAGPTTPTGQGFDLFNQPKDLGFDKDRYFNDQGDYLTDRFTDEGIAFMEKQKGHPFFIYFAFHAVHAPFEAKPDLLEKYEQKASSSSDEFSKARDGVALAATIEAVDQNVGRVRAALKRLGLAENTVIAFTSDNGGNRQFVAPLKGGKGSLHEGGVRVPAMVAGSGISKGISNDEPVLGMDWYPTLLDLAGVDQPKNHKLDGVSLLPLLQGKKELSRDTVFWHFPCYIGGGGPSSSIRRGDWKLIEFFEDDKIELYHLVDDPGETQNLAQTEIKMTDELYARLQAWQKETGAALVTEPNPDFDPTAVRKKGRDQRGKGGKKK